MILEERHKAHLARMVLDRVGLTTVENEQLILRYTLRF